MAGGSNAAESAVTDAMPEKYQPLTAIECADMLSSVLGCLDMLARNGVDQPITLSFAAIRIQEAIDLLATLNPETP